VSEEASPPQRRVVGVLLLVFSAAMAWMIDARPQGLRVPAWVAYAAVACFGLAGAVLVTEANKALRRVLLPLLVACMLAPPLWIVFGAAHPRCGMGFLGVVGMAPEWACRGAFGIGAVVLLLLLAVSLRRP